MSAILIVLVIIIYAQVRTHPFIDYDDPMYVTKNGQVNHGLTASGIRWAFTSIDINWHPVTWLSHMIDVQLFGLHAPPQLLVNVALHAANTVLLLVVLMQLTQRLWASGFAAALFAVHPMHVESVAWLSERKDVLSTFFFLVALLLYVKFVRTRSPLAYAGIVAAFVIGLMAKSMVITLPFVLLLLDYWPLRRLQTLDVSSVWPLVREKLLLFAIVVPSAAITYIAQSRGHAIADANKIPFLARCANAAIAYVTYTAKLFWPANLGIPYPYRVVIAPSKAIAATLLLIAITAAAVALRKRAPYLLIGWLWFVGTLVPVIGIVQIGAQGMADRYSYIPSIGLFIAIVWSIGEAVEHRRALQVPAAVAGCVVVAALSVAAYRQVGYWSDTFTLFRHTVAVTGRNPLAHLVLGEAELVGNAPADAAHDFETVNALSPGMPIAHENLGEAYLALGRLHDAEREFQIALQLTPGDQQILRELADVASRLNRDGEAKQALIRAGAIAGDPAAVAAMALQRGDVSGAIARYSDIAKAHPDSAAAHNDLAAALARAGRDDEAIDHFTRALQIDPRHYEAQMNVAALLSRHNRNDEALSHLQIAAEVRPKSPEPHVYLMLLYAQMSRRPDAVREGKAAMAIDEQAANAQFTEAVRIPAAPDNLRQFVASLGR